MFPFRKFANWPFWSKGKNWHHLFIDFDHGSTVPSPRATVIWKNVKGAIAFLCPKRGGNLINLPVTRNYSMVTTTWGRYHNSTSNTNELMLWWKIFSYIFRGRKWRKGPKHLPLDVVAKEVGNGDRQCGLHEISKELAKAECFHWKKHGVYTKQPVIHIWVEKHSTHVLFTPKSVALSL